MFNDEICQILNKKNELLKQFNNSELQSDYHQLQCIRSELVESVWSSKEKFSLRLLAKLFNQCKSAKTYWPILTIFVNGPLY